MSLTGLKLHLNRFKQINVTLGAAVAEGDMGKVQDCVGVYFKTAAIGEVVSFIFEAEWIEVPKVAATGVTFMAGDPVYYDDSAKAVTNASSGNTFCGISREAAIFSATSLNIALEGAPHRAV